MSCRAPLTNHYANLGLPNTATREQIRSAHRLLAFKHHPDRHMKASAEERARNVGQFRAAQEALDVLVDPQTRAQYDRDFAQQQGIRTRQQQYRQSSHTRANTAKKRPTPRRRPPHRPQGQPRPEARPHPRATPSSRPSREPQYNFSYRCFRTKAQEDFEDCRRQEEQRGREETQLNHESLENEARERMYEAMRQSEEREKRVRHEHRAKMDDEERRAEEEKRESLRLECLQREREGNLRRTQERTDSLQDLYPRSPLFRRREHRVPQTRYNPSERINSRLS